jgi:hypothetical protein
MLEDKVFCVYGQDYLGMIYNDVLTASGQVCNLGAIIRDRFYRILFY